MLNSKLLVTMSLGLWLPIVACATADRSLRSLAAIEEFSVVGDANFKINGTEITANSGKGFLVSKDTYKDFRLRIEFTAAPGTNSGVFFRCRDSKEINDKDCYEANIFDTRPDQTYRTGAITGLVAPKALINAEDGQWHAFEITAIQDKITVLLDGKETVYMRNQALPAGFVALQLAGGAITFRNLEITELTAQELEPTGSNLDGVWELDSMDTVDSAGISKPWCKGAFGVIIYANSYMSTAVNCTSDPTKSVLYAGRMEIKDQTVLHHAQVVSSQSLNRIHTRNFDLVDANHLVLTGALGDSTVIVKWVRR